MSKRLCRHLSEVSPGFTPRPSLSDTAVLQFIGVELGVAGVHAPAFVERAKAKELARELTGVAGVHAPAFVERPLHPRTDSLHPHSVAGVHAPAFVDRWTSSAPTPSRSSVAGVHAPAFVERRKTSPPADSALSSVAGVHAPAFVERSGTPCRWCVTPTAVSPGFTPRPSLSGEAEEGERDRGDVGVAGVHAPAFVERRESLRNTDGISRSVAGVHAPAFVERPRSNAGSSGQEAACRRGSRPGLR